MLLRLKLLNWTREGFITEEQASKIKTYEENKGSLISFKILLYGFAGIMFAAAAISFVAYNWGVLGDIPKIVGAFIALIACSVGSAYLVSLPERKLWTDLLLILSFGVVGATIGVGGQVFQLNGNWADFALYWCGFGLIYVVFSNNIMLGLIWSAILFSSKAESIFEFIHENSALGLAIVISFSAILSLFSKWVFNFTNVAFANAVSVFAWIIMYTSAFIFSLDVSASYSLLSVMLTLVLLIGLLSFVLGNITMFRNNMVIAEIYMFIKIMLSCDNLLGRSVILLICGAFTLCTVYLINKNTSAFEREIK